MKHKKLSLDKVNVVRLNSVRTIMGGRKAKFDTDTAGVGVPHSTHCPDPTPPAFAFDPTNIPPMLSENTKRPAPQSTWKCVPD